MKIIKKILIKEINTYLGLNVSVDDLTRPPQVDLGDWTLPCFSLAKEQKKSPAQMAEELATQLNQPSKIWSKVENQGPYINFYLQEKYWNSAVLHNAGQVNQDETEKIMIEYSQPNTHKEFHVGHLRNACLGSSLVNIYRFMGAEVISANYIGDEGMHVAKCLWGILHLPEYQKKNEEQELTSADLAKCYTAVCQRESRIKEQADKSETLLDFYREISEIYSQINNPKSEIHSLWEKTKKISLYDFYRIYDDLNIEFDEWFWESIEEKSGRKLVTELLKNQKIKNIHESQGAIIADLKEFGLDVLVLIKSDGNSLYGTKDLPLGQKKFDEYGIAKSIYVIDNRQQLYLKQIFKLLDLMGYEDKEKIHVSYDFVTLSDGAMASRKGNVVTYDSLLRQVKSKIYQETKKRHPDWDEEKIALTVEVIAFAAIKFFMLKYENNSVIIFDIDKATALDGASGPYLLYVLARINSIVRKVSLLTKLMPANLGLLNSMEEKSLISIISRFQETVKMAEEKQQPAPIATYLLELAQAFNSFYHQHSVLKADSQLRYARYQLIKSVKKTMESGLHLLNIKGLHEM